jgi:hypothetical protein
MAALQALVGDLTPPNEDIELLQNDMEWYEEQPKAYSFDMKFIREAKIYLRDGYALYFSSWY